MLRAALAFAALTALAAPAAAQDSPAAAQVPPAAAAQELRESCGVIVSNGGAMQVVAVPGYGVINAAAPLTLPPVHNTIWGVVCTRTALVFADTDYRVLIDLHVPLYVSVGDTMIVLEAVEGRLQARTVEGQLTPVQAQTIQTAVNRNQLMMQRQPP